MRSGQFSPMVQGLPRCVQNPAWFYAQGIKALFRMIVFLSILRYTGFPDTCFLGKEFLSTPAGERLEEPYFAVFQRVKIDSDRAVLPPASELPFCAF